MDKHIDSTERLRLNDLQDYEPQEADAWRPRSVPKPQKDFGLAPAPGEDNDAYARQYNTD